MKKTRSTKNALIMSALALVMCVSMLVGSTMAWFTDSVTSTGNKIQAGTLKLDLELYNTDTKAYESIKTSKDPIFNHDKWEPGYTDVKLLKIENEGTLALKWLARFVSANELTSLADVIDVYVYPSETELSMPADRDLTGYTKVGTVRQFVNTIETTTKGTLNGLSSAYLGIALKMQETANNDYQGLDLGGAFDIMILATQATVEKDSFNDQYDKDATVADFSVKTVDELAAAIAKAGDGDVIAFLNDIESTDGLVITDKNITIDLSGNTFTVSEGASTNNRNFKIDGSSVVTIKNGTLSAGVTAYGTVRTEDTANVTLENMTMSNSRGNGLNVKALTGTTVTVNNCVINAANGGGVEAAGGTIVLNNTTITQTGAYDWCSTAIGVNGDGKVVVNSGNYTANTAGTWAAYVMSSGGTLEINGGTFTGVNASGIICADRAAIVNINDGSFNSTGAILNMCNNVGTLPNPVATIAGGTFSADPTVSGGWNGGISVATGYCVLANADGTYTVVECTPVADVADLKDALVAGGNVQLTEDIVLTETLDAKTDAVIDLNGHDITAPANGNMFHSRSDTEPSLIITSSTAGAEINIGGDTAVLLGYGSTEISNVTINITGGHSYSPNPFNVYGDLVLGEGTVVNIDYLGTSLISNNGAVNIVIDGAEINIGTFKKNGLMIELNNATTFEMKNTVMTIDNFVLSQFGGEGLLKLTDGVTIENCTFDVTDSNEAECTFVADTALGRYDLVQK